MKVSLVVPCYNEEKNVALFYKVTEEAFKNQPFSYEVVFVNDGSSDNTSAELKKLFEAYSNRVSVINFSRNFGKEAPILAGIKRASGDYIALVDADLQQRPETVLEMVRILDTEPETDVVAAYQDRRGEGKVLRFFKKCFYSLINRLSDVALRPDASDFRTFRKSVAESILSLGEYHRFSKGIFSWVGYQTHYIPYTACERAAGSTKWSFRKLVNYAIEGIIGFSTRPLRLSVYLGVMTAFAAIVYLIVVVLQKLFIGIDVPGYASIIVLILLLGAMQLLCIGIIGEYVGKTFEQSKNRPIYLTKEVLSYEEN